MQTVNGDIVKLTLEGRILHGCNCQCKMGKGIAKEIKEKLPEAWEADRQTQAGSREKLGDISVVKVERGTFRFYIVNACTGYKEFLEKLERWLENGEF